MAFQTGTATSVPDLATTFATWVSGLGSPWTIDRSDVQGSGRRLQIHKGSVYVNLRFCVNEAASPFTRTIYGILVTGATGYSAGSDWYNQAGGIVAADASSPMAGGLVTASSGITYFFFSDAGDDNIWLVAFNTGEVYNYCGFGTSIEKEGSWTGGPWVCAPRGANTVDFAGSTLDAVSIPPLPPGYNEDAAPGTFVRADVDALGTAWCSLVASTAGTGNRTTRVLMGWQAGRGAPGQNALVTGHGGAPNLGHIWVRSRSPLANNGILSRCVMSIQRTSTRFSMLGHLPMVRAVYTRGNLAAGDQMTVGPATYRVFHGYAIEEV